MGVAVEDKTETGLTDEAIHGGSFTKLESWSLGSSIRGRHGPRFDAADSMIRYEVATALPLLIGIKYCVCPTSRLKFSCFCEATPPPCRSECQCRSDAGIFSKYQ